MLYPVFGMVALTFAVLFLGLGARIRAVKMEQLTPNSFRLDPMDGAPEWIIKTTRHFSNLFEMPILFYVACILCLSLGLSSETLLALAWLYVAARVIHAVIHLSYNNVTHRLIAFSASNLALLGIWGVIVANTI